MDIIDLSGCRTLGHCEHKPCCYCVEEARVREELAKIVEKEKP